MGLLAEDKVKYIKEKKSAGLGLIWPVKFTMVLNMQRGTEDA